MSAEDYYLFRHALVRDAAYQLIMPSERGRLHEAALLALEDAFGGRAPEIVQTVDHQKSFVPHPTDSVVDEIRDHAEAASTEARPLNDLLQLYTVRAAAVASHQYRNEAALSLWRRVATFEGLGDIGLLRAAEVHLRTGNTPAAREMLTELLTIADNPLVNCMATIYLALIEQMSGNVHEAEEAGLRAAAMSQSLGRAGLESMALGNLANLYQETGRYDEAERMQLRALSIQRGEGRRTSESVTLGNLALLYLNTDRLDLAEATFEQSQAIANELNDKRMQCNNLANLALLYARRGRLEASERAQLASLAMAKDIGSKRSEAISLGDLAELYSSNGRAAEAEELFNQALTIHREVGNRRSEGSHRCAYALLLLEQRRRAEAEELWSLGTALLSTVGDTPTLTAHAARMLHVCTERGLEPLPMPDQS